MWGRKKKSWNKGLMTFILTCCCLMNPLSLQAEADLEAAKISMEKSHIIISEAHLQPGDDFSMTFGIPLIAGDTVHVTATGEGIDATQAYVTIEDEGGEEGETPEEKQVTLSGLVYTGGSKDVRLSVHIQPQDEAQVAKQTEVMVTLTASSQEEIVEGLVVEDQVYEGIQTQEGYEVSIKITNKQALSVGPVEAVLQLMDEASAQPLEEPISLTTELKGKETKTIVFLLPFSEKIKSGTYPAMLTILGQSFPLQIQMPEVKEEEETPVTDEIKVEISHVVSPTDYFEPGECFTVKFNVMALSPVTDLQITVQGDKGIIPKSQNLFHLEAMVVGETKQYSVTLMGNEEAAVGSHPIHMSVTYGAAHESSCVEAYGQVMIKAPQVEAPSRPTQQEEDKGKQPVKTEKPAAPPKEQSTKEEKEEKEEKPPMASHPVIPEKEPTSLETQQEEVTQTVVKEEMTADSQGMQEISKPQESPRVENEENSSHSSIGIASVAAIILLIVLMTLYIKRAGA